MQGHNNLSLIYWWSDIFFPLHPILAIPVSRSNAAVSQSNKEIGIFGLIKSHSALGAVIEFNLSWFRLLSLEYGSSWSLFSPQHIKVMINSFLFQASTKSNFRTGAFRWWATRRTTTASGRLWRTSTRARRTRPCTSRRKVAAKAEIAAAAAGRVIGKRGQEVIDCTGFFICRKCFTMCTNTLSTL